MNKRLQAFSSWLQQQHSSFAFVTSSANVFYLSGFRCDPHERLLALLVFPDGEPALVCPQMEVPRARRNGFGHTVIGYDDSADPWEEIERHLKARGVKAVSIAVEKNDLSFARFERLSALFPNAQWLDAEEKLRQLRLIKDEQEMKALRQAAELADKAVEIGVSAIRPGVTELELVAVIEYELKKLGVEGMSFPTTVLAGAKSADPHGVPERRRSHRAISCCSIWASSSMGIAPTLPAPSSVRRQATNSGSCTIPFGAPSRRRSTPAARKPR